MVADLGTKPLTAARIQHLKYMLKMERIPKATEDEMKATEDEMKATEDEKKATEDEMKATEDEKKATEDETEASEGEKKDAEAERGQGEERGKKVWKNQDVEKTRQALQMITLAAAIAAAKGEDGEGEGNGTYELKIGMIVYTVIVIGTTFLLQWMWKVGVRDRRSSAEGENISRPRSLPAEVEEEEGEEECPLRVGGCSTEDEEKTEGGVEDQKKRKEIQKAEGGQKEENQGKKDQTMGSSGEAMRSIVEQWEEIEEEEKVIRSEVMRGLPHVLGSQEKEPGKENEPRKKKFPTRVLKTKWGVVYHTSRACRHLQSSQTGAAKESSWCPRCQKKFEEAPMKSVVGIPLYIQGWGGDFHTNYGCPEIGGATSHPVCATCRNYP